MPDRPPRQVPPRSDPGAADIDTQVEMGWADPQPEPPAPEEPPAEDPPPAA